MTLLLVQYMYIYSYVHLSLLYTFRSIGNFKFTYMYFLKTIRYMEILNVLYLLSENECFTRNGISVIHK